MKKSFPNHILIGLLLCGILSPTVIPPVKAVEPPISFTVSPVTTNLTVPVAMQFAPDGSIYVGEKYGAIKIVQKDGQISTFGQLSVNSDYEQGLLGMVLDPNFATNGYMYVAYTLPDGNSNRVSRITASANRATLVAGSEKILLDAIPSPTGIHQVGELQIGSDGALYIPSGDGGIGSQAASQLDTLNGKMLRIYLDGSIPADNPFVGQAGKRGEIWAYGLRNPFSSGMQKSTGRIFVNDVGKDTWEEIDDLQKGANYGFPACEGSCLPARAGLTDPFYQYSHYVGQSPVVGHAIIAGAWYESDVYPADFKNDYFFGDYVSGWVKRINVTTKQVQNVVEGLQGIVNMKVGPDGLVYVVQLDVTTGQGSIKKLQYGAPLVQPPGTGTQLKVYAAGTPAAGVYPTMEILVDNQLVASQAQVQGNPFTRQFTEYTYQLPSGVTANRVKVNFPNDFLANGEDRNLYIDRISLNGVDFQTEDVQTFSTGTWAPDSGCAPGNKQSEALSCGGYFQFGATTNQKPTANIITPVAETHYNAGTTINFNGNATDPEDGQLPAAKLSWNIVFHHDTHSHPFLQFAATDTGSFTIPDIGEPAANTFYRLSLTATDANGQTSTVTRDIFPNVVSLGLATNIEGLGVTLDAEPRTAPIAVNSVVGFKRTIGAPPEQTINGNVYTFVSWSDNGAATHGITTPGAPTNYLATYALKSGVVVSPLTNPTTITVFAAGSPAVGIYPTMEVQIDGQTVKTFTDVRGNYSTRLFNQYTLTVAGPVDVNKVRVNFTNDAFINGEDRNLYVDKISINDVVFETESQTTYSTGTWTSSTGCTPGNKQSETLSCGGYFAYGSATQPNTTSTLKIYAAGTQAAGIYPTLDVVINGATVQSFTDVRGNYGGRQFQEFTYTALNKIDVAALRLGFNNDAFINGEDRNLYVDKIILDGITYESEAPTTYSLGSWNAATGCSAGNKASEGLSCNGYFWYK